MAIYADRHGRAGTTKAVIAVVSPGTTISFSYPVKSFVIRPSGANVYFKFLSTDADGDAFLIQDGESLQCRIASTFPWGTQSTTVGYVFTSSGTTTVYVAAAI